MRLKDTFFQIKNKIKYARMKQWRLCIRFWKGGEGDLFKGCFM